MPNYARLKRCAAVLAIAAAVPTIAQARGSVRIQQIDGRIEIYQGVRLKLTGDTLRVASADGVGTLVVSKAACTVVDELQRCLPYALILHQHGTHTIMFDHGTVYFNTTNESHQLPHSSKTIPAGGVLALLKTHRGTYISITGRLDEVSK
jgi:hypothetical protein